MRDLFPYPAHLSWIFELDNGMQVDLLPSVDHTNIGLTRGHGYLETPGGVWFTIYPKELDDLITLLRYKQSLFKRGF